MSSIVPVMVGTAGHVHHGKSSLVRLLTGCDTMRLPEERRRALTIELGYAPCTLGGDRLVGIVDVPGHEDFIRTMVAGASCIDVLLLVVAADDGPMPQTLEHLTIVATLRAPRCLAVVTKTDLVDAARADAVAAEVRELLARAGFPDAPVLKASNRSGDGYAEVYAALETLVDAAARREPDPRAFRHDVERAFTTEGHGTVATGVARCGTCAVGDALEILPAGIATQLKGAQAYRHATTRVGTGSCVALNLRDVADDAIPRGATIAWPGIYRASAAAVVHLTNVSTDLTLKRRTEVRLHAGTADAVAQVRLVDADTLPPGGSASAVITARSPLVWASGDRVLLRLLSPSRTIAGGVVLGARDADPGRGERDLGERAQAATACLRTGNGLAAACWIMPEPVVADAEALRLTQRLPADARAVLNARHDCIPLGRRGNAPPSHWLFKPRATAFLDHLAAALDAFHRSHPDDLGMAPRAAAESLALPADCGDDLAHLALTLAPERFAAHHGLLATAAFAPALPPRIAALRTRLLEVFAKVGVNVPARGNLVKDLACTEADLDTLVKRMTTDGSLHVVGVYLVPAAFMDACRRHIQDLAARPGGMDLAAFRAATGLARNQAVEILERCDRDGLTRRQGQVRVLVKR